MTSGPNANEDPDTEGKTVPPYDGRRESADVADAEDLTGTDTKPDMTGPSHETGTERAEDQP